MNRKVPYRQDTVGGCGSYCLANLFGTDFFLKDLVGNEADYVFDLNAKLQKYDKRLFLDVCIRTQSELKRNRLVEHEIYDFVTVNDVSDYIVSIWPTIAIVSNGEKYHYVLAIKDFATGLLNIVDSNNSRVEIMHPQEFFITNYVMGVIVFYLRDSQRGADGVYVGHKRDYPHLFDLSDMVMTL